MVTTCMLSLYYKYIDAEETDVSRNQTSTWLMKTEVCLKKAEIYSNSRPLSFIAAVDVLVS